jgi:hypothetical protein
MAAADQVRYLPESFEYRSPVIVQYTGKHYPAPIAVEVFLVTDSSYKPLVNFQLELETLMQVL